LLSWFIQREKGNSNSKQSLVFWPQKARNIAENKEKNKKYFLEKLSIFLSRFRVFRGY